MSEKIKFPHQAAGKVGDPTRALMNEANERFGVTDGALVRMALESFLPGYLATQGRPENVEFNAVISAALIECPEIRGDIEKVLKNRLRRSASAAA